MMKKQVIYNGKPLGEVEGESFQELQGKAAQLIEAQPGFRKPSAERMMFSTARQFHEVAGDTCPKEMTTAGLSRLTVFCVNAAFGLEVYLKLLLKLESGAYPREHYLKKLYASLSTSAKSELENRFSRLLSERFPNSTEAFQSAEETCSHFSKAFPAWRYRFEHPLRSLHVPHVNVVVLLDVLSRYCFELLGDA